MIAPLEFVGVTAVAKANVYFDGKVVSHTIRTPDGGKKTLGLIYPGEFHLDRKSTRLNSSHIQKSRMPSSA